MSLDNVNVQKSVREHIIDYLSGLVVDYTDVLTDINEVLAKHNTSLIVENIHKGKRPSRNMRNFPAISVVSNSRSTEWYASRTTLDTVSLRIFCVVLNEDQPSTEELMEDFTDAVVSALYKQTKFHYTVPDLVVGGTNPTNYALYDCKPTNISYGSVDSGHLRAGQIEWQGKMLVTQDGSF